MKEYLEEPTMSRPSVPWSIRDVLLGVGVAVIIYGLAYATAFALSAWSYQLGPNQVMAVLIAVQVLLVAPAWWFSVHKYRVSTKALGFAGFKASALPRITGLLLLLLILEALYSILMEEIGVETRTDPSPILSEMQAPWLFVLSTAIVAPVTEEVFFRGFVFGGLRARLDWRLAALISAALFSGFHLDLAGASPLFVVGCVFAYIYHRYGSIWPGMIGHACVNGLIVLLWFVGV